MKTICKYHINLPLGGFFSINSFLVVSTSVFIFTMPCAKKFIFYLQLLKTILPFTENFSLCSFSLLGDPYILAYSENHCAKLKANPFVT